MTGHGSTHDDLWCEVDGRRRIIRREGFNGIDFVEVSDDQRRLDLHLIDRAPPEIGSGNVRLTGGRRVRDLRIVDVRAERHDDPNVDDRIVVTVDRPGDFSTYRLCLVESDERGRPTEQPLGGFDPRYASVDVHFKAGCPTDLDCRPTEDCPPESRTNPAIDYLARDWDGLRRVLFDRLALLVPDWTERHVPDAGVTLVEVLAYVGDRLSYYQDAVATEAYLETARKRVSVRRHARLVDYHLHEGCNARAWVCLAVSDILEFDLGSVAVAALDQTRSTSPLAWDDLMTIAPSSRQVYEPVGAGSFVARPEHNLIRFYTWGDHDCCLLAGGTRATLVDEWLPGEDESDPKHEHDGDPGQHDPRQHRPGRHDRDDTCDDDDDGIDGDGRQRRLRLRPGDVLVFEEVIGPDTGLAADADPSRRHAVCLTEVEATVDPVTRTPIVEIAWADADALPFPLCLSTHGPPPDCEPLVDVSVACGNVVLVDHGATVEQDLGEVPIESSDETCGDDCHGPTVTLTPGRFRPALDGTPLSHCADAVPCPASGALLQDPHAARAHLVAHEFPAGSGNAPAPGDGIAWYTVPDLLRSDGDDRHLVVEVDERGRAELRFGDGRTGRRPTAGSRFTATYRLGNGVAGNVGAEAINRFVTKETVIDGVSVSVRNPLPAMGGIEPEPVRHARLRAPHAFRTELARAVTPDDYAAIVERDFSEVQAASAAFRFSGSHVDVLVAVDQRGGSEVAPALLERIAGHLETYRRIGHDVVVRPAEQVPLRLAVTVCVEATYLRAPVEAAVRDALSARRNPDGSLGFFHPDRRTFGASVALSDIVAAVQRIEGVEGVTVREFHRLGGPPMGELEAGVLWLSPLEIARLDNDRSLPEFGALEIEMRGGR